MIVPLFEAVFTFDPDPFLAFHGETEDILAWVDVPDPALVVGDLDLIWVGGQWVTGLQLFKRAEAKLPGYRILGSAEEPAS